MFTRKRMATAQIQEKKDDKENRPLGRGAKRGARGNGSEKVPKLVPKLRHELPAETSRVFIETETVLNPANDPLYDSSSPAPAEHDQEDLDESSTVELRKVPIKTPQRPDSVRSGGFSLQQRLDMPVGDLVDTQSLKCAVERGDYLDIGRQLRSAKKHGSLTEVQITEVSKSTLKPNVGLFSFIDAVESSTTDDLRSILVAQQYMSTFQTSETQNLVKMEASVNSISTAIHRNFRLDLMKKVPLNEAYITEDSGPFKSRNIGHFYQSLDLVGDTSGVQLTDMYMKLFKDWLQPAHQIWLYCFRPNSVRKSDKHFESLPPSVTRKLQDFGIDSLGLYLPEHLLRGEVSPGDSFVENLGSTDNLAEIERRRSVRQHGAQLVNFSLGRALRNLRAYHFDDAKSELLPCKLRSACDKHFRWDSMRHVREDMRKKGDDPNKYVYKMNPDNVSTSGAEYIDPNELDLDFQ